MKDNYKKGTNQLFGEGGGKIVLDIQQISVVAEPPLSPLGLLPLLGWNFHLLASAFLKITYFAVAMFYP